MTPGPAPTTAGRPEDLGHRPPAGPMAAAAMADGLPIAWRQRPAYPYHVIRMIPAIPGMKFDDGVREPTHHNPVRTGRVHPPDYREPPVKKNDVEQTEHANRTDVQAIGEDHA